MKNDSNNILARELAQALINFKRFGIQKHHDQDIDIRQSEFMMLAIVVNSNKDHSSGVKISELGVKSQITPAAVTHIIDVLVDKKYVKRFDDPSDRRVVLIKPTEKGTEIVDSMKIRLINRCEEMIGFLGKNDSRDLIRITNKIFEYFKKRKKI